LKCYLQKHFETNDLESLWYFLDIEVVWFRKRITFLEEVCIDVLSKTDMFRCKAADASMKVNVKLLLYQKDILDDICRYYRLVKKLNYLTVIRPDIAFVVSVVTQFLSAPMTTYWDATM